MEKICLKIIKYGTYLVLFTPIIISNKFFFPYVGPKSLYFFALVEIIFFSYLILISVNRRYLPRPNLLLIVLGILLIILTLSSVFGVDFQTSFWSKYERMTGLLMWLHLFAFFVVLSSVFSQGDEKKRDEEWFKIFGVSVLAAISISLISIFEKMGIEIIGSSGRGGATLGNSSFLGTYLLFNFFFALYLFFKTNSLLNCEAIAHCSHTARRGVAPTGSKFQPGFYKYFNFYALLGVGLIGLALWFSEAQAALLSTFGGLALLGILWLAFCQRSKPSISTSTAAPSGKRNIVEVVLLGKLKYVGISLVALGILAGIVLVSLIFYSPQLVEDKLTEQFGSSVIVSRFEAYRIGWAGFMEKPWLGWGPENFGLVFTGHFNPQYFFSEKFGADVWYDRSHNIIFDTLATTGILGFLGYLSIFAGTFYVLWRGFFGKRIDFWTAGIFSVALISYFVQNLTVFDMVNSYLVFFLVLAFVGSIGFLRPTEKEAAPLGGEPRSAPAGREKEKKNPPRLWQISMILVIAIFSFVNFVIQPLRADYYTIAAVKTPPFTEQRLSLYKKALGASPVGRDQIREFFADSIVPFIRQPDITQKVPRENILREFDFLTQEMEKSAKRNPLNFRIFLSLGEFYNYYSVFDKSKLADAERALEKAIELSPTNQQGYWYLAQTRVFEGKLQEAFDLGQKALDLEPRAEKSHLILIQIARFTGDQQLLEEKIRAALEINPEWATSIKEILGIEGQD